MKLIDRYEFTNGKALETWYLDAEDLAQRGLPECDVIGLRRISDSHDRMLHLRPDEALILARLLIGAVHQVSEGYKVGPPKKDEGWVALYRERMRELGVDAIIGEDFTESNNACD